MLKCHVHNVWCTDHSSMFICTQKTAWRHTLLPDRKMDIYLCQKKLLGSYSYWFLVVYIQYWQVEQNRAKSSIFHFFVQLLSPSNALPHFHTHPIDNGRGLNQATAAVDKLYFFSMLKENPWHWYWYVLKNCYLFSSLRDYTTSKTYCRRSCGKWLEELLGLSQLGKD